MLSNEKNTFLETLSGMNIAVFALPPGEKKPKGVANNGWQKTKPGNTSIEDNYGIIVPYGWVVVDVDLYKTNAPESWEGLLASGLSTHTFTCRSARGGFHYYYKLSSVALEAINEGATIGRKHPSFLGIDFLSLRGDKPAYVVGPYSETKDGQYTISFGDIKNCATLPDSIFEELVRTQSEGERVRLKTYAEIHDLMDEDFELERYRVYCNAAPGLSDGEGRDEATYIMAAEGHDYGLSENQTFEALRDCWNPRNLPPLTLSIIAEKVTKAYKYAKDEKGNKSAHVSLFEPFNDTSYEGLISAAISVREGGASNFTQYNDAVNGKWDVDDKGRLKASSRNLRRLFQREAICHGRFTLRGIVRYDLLAERPVLAHKPFWRQWNDTSPLIISDADIVALKFFFANRFEVEFSVAHISECILETAKRDPFHPIKDWLETLEWDGVKRLEHVFLEYFEVIPDEDIHEEEIIDYRKAMACGFIIAAIERVFTPGSKWDYMLTLVGPQGTGKSQFVQILGGGKYSAVVYAIATDHRALQAMQGGWIVEFPELSAAKKTDVDSIKAFTSACVDKFIPLHGKSGPQEYPRKFVPVWTLNPPPEGFLKDLSGERRFLVIDVPNTIDFQALIEDRDQIFAEAMVMYRRGPKSKAFNLSYECIAPFVEMRNGQCILAKIQDQFKALSDPWAEILRDYLEGRQTQKTASERTYEFCHKTKRNYESDRVQYSELFMALGLHSPSAQGHKEKLRIVRCMKELGYACRVSNNKRCFQKLIGASGT